MTTKSMEEGTNEGQAQPAQAQQQPAAAMPTPAQEALMNLGSFMPAEMREQLSKLDVEEAKIAKPDANQQQVQQQSQQQPDGDDNKGADDEGSKNDGAAKPEGDATKADDKKGEEGKPEPKKSKLGLGKQKEAPKGEVKIEKIEDVFGVLKSKYGQEAAKPEDLNTFFKTADKWRADSQELKPTKERLTGLEEEIKRLPGEFFEAFKLFAEGGDYTQPFSKKSAIDFRNPADKQDVKALVNHYFPNKFQDSDFAEEDKSDLLKAHIDFAKEKFNGDKTSYDQQRAKVATDAKKAQEAYKSSVEGSVNGLQSRFPDMEPEAFTEVKSLLDGGARKIMSLFLNDDGTLKPEAGVRITMALYGESELIPDAMELAAHIAETKVNEDRITKGADKPHPTKSGGSAKADQVPQEVKNQIEEMQRLAGMQTKKTFG